MPPPSKVTTPMSSAITLKTAASPSTSSTCAAAKSSIAASSSGKTCPELVDLTTCPCHEWRVPRARPEPVEGLESETWETEVAEAPDFNAGPVFSALLKQLYIDQNYVPRCILVPVDFDDREPSQPSSPNASATASKSQFPSAARNAPSSTSPDKTRSSPTSSASASSNPRAKPFRSPLPTR